MSVLSYNGVTLPYASTTSYHIESVAEQMAGVDAIYTKYDIVVNCIIHGAYLSLLAPDIGQSGITNPTAILDVIRSRLLQRRQALHFYVGGVDLIPLQAGVPGTVDARNGPIPVQCIIQPTDATNSSFLLSYHITAHYHECNTTVSAANGVLVQQNNPGSVVLSNRWTETVDLDDCQYTTRTRQGTFVIRSDNNQGAIADLMRSQFAVVGVPQGFTRESSNYTITTDGLSVQYRIVDKEQYRLPPSPAFSAEGSYSQSSSFPNPLHVGEATVRLKGVKPTAQQGFSYQDYLVATALGIALGKLLTTGTPYLPQQGSVRVNLWHNEVEARVTAALKPGALANLGRGQFQVLPAGGLPALLWGFSIRGISNLSVGNPWQPPYKDRGSAPLLLQAAAYYDPCLQSNALNAATGQNNLGLDVGQAGVIQETTGQTGFQSPWTPLDPPTGLQLVPIAQIIVVPDLPAQPLGARYKDQTYNSGTIWTDYAIRNRYENDGHIYMMPVAQPAGVVSQGQPTVAFVQLAAPTTLWVADWTASRFQICPDIPDPNQVKARWILMDQHVEPAEMELAGDGQTPLYRISGTYVYGCLNPSAQPTDDMAFGDPAWLDDTNLIRTIPSTALVGNIIAPPTV